MHKRVFSDCIIVASVNVLFSVRDVVAGRWITIVRIDTGEVYYFGMYDGQANTNARPLVTSLYPRDLMTKSYYGQETYGAVSLRCDDSDIPVMDNDRETTSNIHFAHFPTSQNKTCIPIVSTRWNPQFDWAPFWIWWGGGPTRFSRQSVEVQLALQGGGGGGGHRLFVTGFLPDTQNCGLRACAENAGNVFPATTG